MTQRRINDNDYKIYLDNENDYCDYFRVHKHLTDKIQLECVMDIRSPNVNRCYKHTRCYGYNKRNKGKKEIKYEVSNLRKIWDKR